MREALVSVKHMTRTPELIEDMGDWENVNCYASGSYTLNKWTDHGLTARVVSLKKNEVLVIRAKEHA